eukprot:366567-Chlamydomonas_euryale.AAC.10
MQRCRLHTPSRRCMRARAIASRGLPAASIVHTPHVRHAPPPRTTCTATLAVIPSVTFNPLITLFNKCK